MWQWLVGGSSPSTPTEEVPKYKSEPLITLAKAKLRLPSGKWNEIQNAWRTITGLEDVNQGGLPMNDPGLLFLLGSIFCKTADNPLQQVDLLERINRDRHDISWLSEHFDANSLDIAERMMKVFGCIFDLDSDGEILWPEFVSGVVILTHGSVEEKAEAVFRAIDTDGNMVLSLDELQRFAESMLKGAKGTLRESQDRFHISFSGRPVQDGEEYKGLLLSDVARILVEADSNRDFQLSFTEYNTWVRKRIAQGNFSSPFIPEVVVHNDDGSRECLTSSMM